MRTQWPKARNPATSRASILGRQFIPPKGVFEVKGWKTPERLRKHRRGGLRKMLVEIALLNCFLKLEQPSLSSSENLPASEHEPEQVREQSALNTQPSRPLPSGRLWLQRPRAEGQDAAGEQSRDLERLEELTTRPGR